MIWRIIIVLIIIIYVYSTGRFSSVAPAIFMPCRIKWIVDLGPSQFIAQRIILVYTTIDQDL